MLICIQQLHKTLNTLQIFSFRSPFFFLKKNFIRKEVLNTMARMRTKQIICRRFKQNNNENLVSNFDIMPIELITDVFSRVASSSLADLFSLQFSCKAMQRFGKEDYIYKHATLEKFPVVSWWPLKTTAASFLDNCWKNQNPEALYRRGVVDYFGESKEEVGLECLEKAAKFGHVGALYVLSIIYIFRGSEYKEKGIKMLNKIKKMMSRKVRECRKDLKSILRLIWIKNSLILNQRPRCCTRNHRMVKKNGWILVEDDQEDNLDCEACICDNELTSICNVLPNVIP